MKFFRLKNSDGQETGPALADPREATALVDTSEGDSPAHVALFLHGGLKINLENITLASAVEQLEAMDRARGDQEDQEQEGRLQRMAEQLPAMVRELIRNDPELRESTRSSGGDNFPKDENATQRDDAPPKKKPYGNRNPERRVPLSGRLPAKKE